MERSAADQPHPFDAARAPDARGAGAEVERMRIAYLDLLKLVLCDLAGEATTSVGRLADGRLFTRRVGGEARAIRAVGMDWPLDGTTMVGLRRLDDLQACVEAVVADGVAGDLIEAGVWRGGASILVRATLDSLGATDRDLWLADSFAGFTQSGRGELSQTPEDQWLDYIAVSAGRVRENFRRLGYTEGLRFVRGFFTDTMPGLAGRRWALIRLDGDTYDATRDCLKTLYPGLAPGGYAVIDDYGAVEDCRRAVDEYRERNGITEELETIDWTAVRWRRSADAEAAPAAPAAADPSDPPTEFEPATPAQLASEGEIALANENQALRAELERLRAELEAARGR